MSTRSRRRDSLLIRTKLYEAKNLYFILLDNILNVFSLLFYVLWFWTILLTCDSFPFTLSPSVYVFNQIEKQFFDIGIVKWKFFMEDEVQICCSAWTKLNTIIGLSHPPPPHRTQTFRTVPGIVRHWNSVYSLCIT